MPRPVTPLSFRGRSFVPDGSNHNGSSVRTSSNNSSRNPSLSPVPQHTTSRLGFARRARLDNSGPMIMTRAQARRQHARVTSASGAGSLIRSVGAARNDSGPTVVSRSVGSESNSAATVTSSLVIHATKITPNHNANRRRPISSITAAGYSNEPQNSQNNQRSTSSVVAPSSERPIRTARRNFASGASTSAEVDAALPSTQTSTVTERSAPSSYSILRYRRFAGNRVTFDTQPDPSEVVDEKDSVTKVLTSEKILPRILRMMNWNELLPLRSVCKAWFEFIESQPQLTSVLGMIVIRSTMESRMAIYNASSVTWKRFRFLGPYIFDMTKPVQNEFWNKHGPLMIHLEISNRAMNLTGLVEILARCPKLEVFKCNWTPEMYSFNSELIRKYYGIHFNNGAFANLKDLSIESSSSLTDTALWSILKWCGGSIKSLTLTSPMDEDVLTRLKPRWSVDSIKNYFDRFGYTGNLQYLDFSWSNLTVDDIKSLCTMDIILRGITLNYCKLNDDILHRLVLKHGSSLEVFKLEGTPISEHLFTGSHLPKVKVLHIGGYQSSVRSLDFLREMPNLEELSCHDAQWLEQSMLLKPFNSKLKRRTLKSLDLSGGVKHAGNKNLDPNLNKTWFSDFTGLISNIRELNLSQWSLFGTNMNFKSICQRLNQLEKLIVREWKQLTDVGTTGLEEHVVYQDWGDRMPLRPRVYIGLLKSMLILFI